MRILELSMCTDEMEQIVFDTNKTDQDSQTTHHAGEATFPEMCKFVQCSSYSGLHMATI